MAQTYTIKEVADQFGVPVSTIRYYDKRGLLPFVAKNESGYREFTPTDLNLIKTIMCLKTTEMPIKEIQQYIECCMAGPETIPQRQALLRQHRQRVLAKQAQIEQDLKEIDFKINRYEDPHAVEIIQAEVAYVKHEKKQLHLASGFA